MSKDSDINRLGTETLDMIQLNTEILKLIDELRDVKKRTKRTPFYHIMTRWKLYKEWSYLNKRADEIRERLNKIEANPIQIVARK